ncbi:MAG: CYTH domain-containing protein [Butyrivibrio sp.]
MEIERKFLIEKIPFSLDGYPKHEIEQAYLCTKPVVRIRKSDNDYYLTYKGKGKIAREEYNLPLTKESYEHLLTKADGNVLTKTRYLIPERDGLTIELDVFHGKFHGLVLAEVEFETLEQSDSYRPPEWFGRDVSITGEYQNSVLSRKEF